MTRAFSIPTIKGLPPLIPGLKPQRERKEKRPYPEGESLTTGQLAGLAEAGGETPRAEPVAESAWLGPVNKVLEAFDFAGNETRKVLFGGLFDDVDLLTMPKNFAGRDIVTGKDIAGKLGIENDWGRAIAGFGIDVILDPLWLLGGPWSKAIGGAATVGKGAMSWVPKILKAGVRVIQDVGKVAAATGDAMKALRGSRFLPLFENVAPVVAQFNKLLRMSKGGPDQAAKFLNGEIGKGLAAGLLADPMSAAAKASREFFTEHARRGLALIHLPFTGLALELPGVGRHARRWEAVARINRVADLAEQSGETAEVVAEAFKARQAMHALRTEVIMGAERTAPFMDALQLMLKPSGAWVEKARKVEQKIWNIPSRFPIIGRPAPSEARMKTRGAQNLMAADRTMQLAGKLSRELYAGANALTGGDPVRTDAMARALERIIIGDDVLQANPIPDTLIALAVVPHADNKQIYELVQQYIADDTVKALAEKLRGRNAEVLHLDQAAGVPVRNLGRSYIHGAFTPEGVKLYEQHEKDVGRAAVSHISRFLDEAPSEKVHFPGVKVEIENDRLVLKSGPAALAKLFQDQGVVKILQRDELNGELTLYAQTLQKQKELRPLLHALRDTLRLAAERRKATKEFTQALEKNITGVAESAKFYQGQAEIVELNVRELAAFYREQGEDLATRQLYEASAKAVERELGPRIKAVVQEATKTEDMVAALRKALAETEGAPQFLPQTAETPRAALVLHPSIARRAEIEKQLAEAENYLAVLKRTQDDLVETISDVRAEFDFLGPHPTSESVGDLAARLDDMRGELGEFVKAIEGRELTPKYARLVKLAQDRAVKAVKKAEKIDKALKAEGWGDLGEAKFYRTTASGLNRAAMRGELSHLFGPRVVNDMYLVDPGMRLVLRTQKGETARYIQGVVKWADQWGVRVPGMVAENVGSDVSEYAKGMLNFHPDVPYRAPKVDANSLWAKLAVTEDGSRIFYPEGIADAIENIAKSVGTDEGGAALVQGLARITGLWKTQALLDPSWQVVNWTAVLNHVFNGAKLTDMIRWTPKAWQILRGKLKPDDTLVIGGQEMKVGEILADARTWLTVPGFGRETMGKPGKPAVSLLVERMPAAAKAKDKLENMLDGWFKMNEFIDVVNKLTGAFSHMEQGASWKDAVQRALVAGFDYGDLGNASRLQASWLTILVPFWRWQRNVGPFYLWHIINRPAVFAAVPGAARMIEEGLVGRASLPPELRPDWFRNEIGVQLWGDEKSAYGVMTNTLFPGQEALEMLSLPFGFGGPARTVAASLNPAIQSIFEHATNVEVFSRKELKEGGVGESALRFVQGLRPFREQKRRFQLLAEGEVGEAAARLALGGRFQQMQRERGVLKLKATTMQDIAVLTRAVKRELRPGGDSGKAQAAASAIMEKYRVRRKFGAGRVPKAALPLIGAAQ